MQLCIIRTYVTYFKSIGEENENKNSENRNQIATCEKTCFQNKQSVQTPSSHFTLKSTLRKPTPVNHSISAPLTTTA